MPWLACPERCVPVGKRKRASVNKSDTQPSPLKEKDKKDTHDGGGHEYVDVPRLWREPPRDFQKLRFKICSHTQEKSSVPTRGDEKRKRAKG